MGNTVNAQIDSLACYKEAQAAVIFHFSTCTVVKSFVHKCKNPPSIFLSVKSLAREQLVPNEYQ